MDPLTALSLAGTIIQFVDFGSKLLSEAYKLYKSPKGILTANEEFELVTIDLKAFVDKLKPDLQAEIARPLTEDEAIFEDICQNATKIAEEIMGRLNKLKVLKDKHRKWESMRQAVKSAWTKDEMLDLKKRLALFKDALETRVLFSIRERLDSASVRSSNSLDKLEEHSRNAIATLLEIAAKVDRNDASARNLRGHLGTITHLLRRIDSEKIGDRQVLRDMVAAQVTAEIEMLDVPNSEEKQLQKAIPWTIIESLKYTAMSDRYEAVSEAYPHTFEWAFLNSDREQLRWDDLSQWLAEGDGIYWIHGKPGCGKTTLMKHVFDDSRTREALTKWAKRQPEGSLVAPLPVCLASFFFWNSGNSEQRSHTGLLRGLLHQILTAVPDLLPVVLPERWATLYAAMMDGKPASVRDPWRLKDLTTTFERLIAQKTIPLKLCLLIDGLDEFDGDHEALSTMLKKIVENSDNLKLVVSSRPWEVFKECFCTCSGLRLQDLTDHDIGIYVTRRFQESPSFQKFLLEEPKLVPVLVREIVEKADGVFLWVRLAVTSILDGIRNRDDVSILQQRLRLLPRELVPLYAHLLPRIEPVYLLWISKAFQILRASQDIQKGAKIRRSFEDPDLKLSISRFYFAINEEVDVEEVDLHMVRGFTAEHLLAGCEKTAVQLNARSAGFLEVPSFEQKGVDASVEYLHRTVRDFLEQKETWSQFIERTTETSFSPHVSLLRGCSFWLGLKTTTRSHLEIESMALHAMFHAYHADVHSETRQIQVRLLDDLDCTMSTLPGAGENWTDFPTTRDTSLPLSFLELATMFNLSGFIMYELDQKQRLSAASISTELLHLLLPKTQNRTSLQLPPPRISTVAVLIDFGADLNRKFSNID
ncbi:hypothetical protein EG329_005666 [Mollisiaceae sp. DMI_Dod_QoI]|nr:hypothetical protein EG329_005666 [Helotiales sp. DMI_Dod_QoI]